MSKSIKSLKIKNVLPMMMLGLTLSACAFAGPGNFSGQGNEKFSTNALAKTATPLINYSLVNSNSSQGSIHKMVNAALLTQEKSDEEIIQDLLHQFDTIINNDNNYKVETAESDKEEYKYKEIITFKDLLNQENTYSLYYNEKNVEQDIDEDDDEDEIETEITYTGLAVKDDKEFKFKLELEEEIETDEKEIESTFYLFSTEDYKTYTKVTSSSEIEDMESETEYSYEVVENGRKTIEYEMEIEFDEKENEVELNLELNEKEYSIERIENSDGTFFHVEFENDDTDEEREWIYKKVIDGDSVSYIIVG